MKIIITHGTTKREIDGPFNLCGSGRDLKALADSIYTAIFEDADEPANTFYGWVFVRSLEPFHSGCDGQKPQPWD